jgi:hypothetical protein
MDNSYFTIQAVWLAAIIDRGKTKEALSEQGSMAPGFG